MAIKNLDIKSQYIKLPKTPRKNPLVTERWFVVQVLDDNDEWIDLIDNDLTRSEARNEMCAVSCFGHMARIIERTAAFRVVAEKDFRK